MRIARIPPGHVAWSLAACARIHKVTIREIAAYCGITLKRVREIRDASSVPEITAWEFVQSIREIGKRKRLAHPSPPRSNT